MTFLEKALIIFLIIVSLFFNTFRLSSIPAGLHGDEAQHGLQALEILNGKTRILDFGWYGLPIPSFYGQVAGIWAFGRTIFALRISSAIIGTVTLIPFYFLVKLLIDRKTALFSVVLLGTSHWWIAFSRLGENYIQAPFVAVVGFLLIVLSFRTKNIWVVLGTGVVIGMNFYLYFAARLTPVFSLFLIAYYSFTTKPTRTTGKIVLFMSIGFLLAFLPFFISSVRQPKVAFSRQNDVYIYGAGLGSRWREATYGQKNVFGVVSGQLQRIFSFSSQWQDMSGQYGYRGWMIDPFSGLLLILSLLGLVLIRGPKTKFFPLIWFVFTLFFGWILTENPPFSPRMAGAIPAFAILIGFGMNILHMILKKTPKIIQTLSICLVFLCIIVINLHAYFIQGVNERWGDANKYIATEIAMKINTLQGYTTIFLTAPYIYGDFGPIEYVTSHANVISVDNPAEFRATNVSHTLYVLYPQYNFLLRDIISANPNGIEDRETFNGQDQVLYYQVN